MAFGSNAGFYQLIGLTGTFASGVGFWYSPHWFVSVLCVLTGFVMFLGFYVAIGHVFYGPFLWFYFLIALFRRDSKPTKKNERE
jgi:hypothetical protein